MLKFIRISSFLICLLSGPLAFLWILSRGISMFYWFALAVPFLWIVLMTLWFLCLGRPRFLIRLKWSGIVVGILAIAIFAATKLLKYDGSTSGTSLPKLVWAWSDTDVEISHAHGKAEIISKDIPREVLKQSAGESLRFLGPDSDGVWEDTGFSSDWANNPPVEIWRRPMGYGWSSFSVTGEKAITLEEIGETEQISCFDLFTGERLWEFTYPGLASLDESDTADGGEGEEGGGEKPGGRMDGKGPRSTPTIHEGKVYAYGSVGILICCDLETGKLIWKKNVIKELKGKVPKWGKSCAPLVMPEHNAVIVSAGDGKGTTLAAFQLASGDPLWVTEGSGSSYSSPVAMTIHDTEQIVSINSKEVVGVRPDDGRVIWKHEWPGNYPKVAQPVRVGASRLLLTASYGVPSLLIEINRDGDQWTTKELWTTNRMKTKFSSTVVLGDHAYGLDEGRLASIDLETGEKAWKIRGYGFGQLILVGDHLLIQAEQGDLVFGKVGPDGFEETATLEALNSMTWNVPTLAGRLLLLRNDREAVCYLLPEKNHDPST